MSGLCVCGVDQRVEIVGRIFVVFFCCSENFFWFWVCVYTEVVVVAAANNWNDLPMLHSCDTSHVKEKFRTCDQ
jgi:hypothetical protein